MDFLEEDVDLLTEHHKRHEVLIRILDLELLKGKLILLLGFRSLNCRILILLNFIPDFSACILCDFDLLLVIAFDLLKLIDEVLRMLRCQVVVLC